MEKLSDIARGGVIDRATAGLKTIIPAKQSRPVTLKDIWRVVKDSTRIKLAMLSPFPGKYEKAASISHCQIEREDPLRFFTCDSEFGWYFGWGKLFPIRTIINPKIVWHGKNTEYSREACMSYPFENIVKIVRWQIIEMEYWTILGIKRRKKFYEFRAAMCQHELDHFELINIFDRKRQRNK